MYGIHREKMALFIYIVCYYCFGFPLGIIYGFKGFLTIDDPRFRHINGLWLGASFGIFISLCILILIRIRIDWESEIKRTQKLLGEMDIKIESFRNRLVNKYGRYSHYGINSVLIDESNFGTPSDKDRDGVLSSGAWSTSENILTQNDATEIRVSRNKHSSSGHYNYYDHHYIDIDDGNDNDHNGDINHYKNSDNIDESLPVHNFSNDDDDHDQDINISNPINYDSGIVDDFRIGPYGDGNSMGRSFPQSVGPPITGNSKQGPIII